jgi:MoxR-like ATPase
VNPTEIAEKARHILEAVEIAIVGKSDVIELALSVLLSNGHLLIEDIPGVGKTTLAKALSRALGLSFKRIQFTPDLLPSDITGSSIYNQKTGEFEVRPGPVFANIVLADEINRTTPKTQAALLECMEERQVTIDGVGHPLPRPFFVIATQNNIEMAGTYPLPEAQMDRFAARIRIGYPDRQAEMEILRAQRQVHPVESVQPVVTQAEIIAMQSAVREVYVDEDVLGFILDIVEQTRKHVAVALGSSPRGALNLLHVAQARAAFQGRNAILPDDVKTAAVAVLAHRVVVRPEQRVRGVSGESVVQEILRNATAPVAVRAK